MTQAIVQKRLSLRGYALMAFLALIWGGSFTANHLALASVPVATTVAARVGGAALVLWAYIALARLPVPLTGRFLVTSLVLGLGNNILPFTLIVWGQTHVPSGLAGILNASTALFSVLVAAAVFPDERLTPNRLIGVILGLAGVAAIIGPAALTHLDLTSLGQLAILGAGLAYAFSAAFGRRRLVGIRPEVGAAGMLTAAALIMLPAALLLDGPPGLPPASALAALAYLAILSSALAYRIYYTVLAEAGAGNLSLVTLFVAPVAVFFGWAALGEALPPSAFAGLAFLTLGMILIDGRLTRRFFQRPSA
jgi:drug/metabolite transporter (DMT)-like permease